MTPVKKTTSKPSTPRDVENGRLDNGVISIGKLDPGHLDYAVIYEASAQDRIDIVKGGIKASIAKRIVSDLDMPAARTYEALHVSISTINRKAKTDALLRSDEGERVLGLAKLVGQVESMVQGMDGAE